MNEQNRDPIADALQRYAQNILVVVFGLLPLFFIPSAFVPFEYSKIFLALTGIVSALVLTSLSVLRSGKIQFTYSLVLAALWAVVLLAAIASFLSGDIRDSLYGDVLSTHATAFVAVLALTVTVWQMQSISKTTVMRLYMLLAGSTLALVVFHILRLFIGAGPLSLGVFTSSISTPVGSWNDLALFLGLSVLLSLVALDQLPLTKHGRALFGTVIVLALGMLGIINFFTVWLILGLVSLVMVVYALGKDKLAGSQPTLVAVRSTNTTSLLFSLVVFVASVLFIVGGAALGGMISKVTNISYIEVRPSFEATADIARNVYHENAFLGTGPNKFADAWRLYKDNAINQTVFWNTDFNAGNGYITTFFITTGVLGGLAWLTFLGLFIVRGMRILLTASDADRMWYFIGVSSFVSALYIWGMSLIYVPGAVVLILGALCTGIAIGAGNVLSGKGSRTFSIVTNRRTGFLVTLGVIAVIIGSVSVLYTSGRHYAAMYTFNEAMYSLDHGGTPESISGAIARAFELSPSDMYARRMAEYEFMRMNQLLATPAPTEVEQKLFEQAVVSAVNASDQARLIDPSEPSNWAIRGGIYSLLMSLNIEGVYDRALEALNKARELNPKNPIPYLALAELEGRAGNFESARTNTETAIGLKPNYTDAFFYLSQLDIVTGNVEGAIRSTQSIIALEPQNPARYYQLGVLETSRKNVDGAIVAFEKAIALDTNYANARYLLALAYDQKGRAADAKVQLEKVLELNPGNTDVTTMLGELGRTGKLTGTASSSASARVVSETSAVSEENGTVRTNEAPDSTLVSPVNTVPEKSVQNDAAEAPAVTQ